MNISSELKIDRTIGTDKKIKKKRIGFLLAEQFLTNEYKEFFLNDDPFAKQFVFLLFTGN